MELWCQAWSQHTVIGKERETIRRQRSGKGFDRKKEKCGEKEKGKKT